MGRYDDIDYNSNNYEDAWERQMERYAGCDDVWDGKDGEEEEKPKEINGHILYTQYHVSCGDYLECSRCGRSDTSGDNDWDEVPCPGVRPKPFLIEEQWEKESFSETEQAIRDERMEDWNE
jgi:hypothetical protein